MSLLKAQEIIITRQDNSFNFISHYKLLPKHFMI